MSQWREEEVREYLLARERIRNLTRRTIYLLQDDLEETLSGEDEDQDGIESNGEDEAPVEIESNGEDEDQDEIESNLDAESLLGEGKLGQLYKGKLRDQVVAIRRTNPVSPQSHDKFVSVAKKLSKLDYLNIVKLIGVCMEGRGKFLIHEYVPLGSLESHLFAADCAMADGTKTKLDWLTRMNIALGVARGLRYLHSKQPPVVHRNLKCSNILLGKRYIAKLSDIGLFENVQYDLPGHPEMGKLTLESDIYGFGLLLLEIVTYRRIIGGPSTSAQPKGAVDWANALLSEGGGTVTDNVSLVGQKSSTFHRAANLVRRCLHDDPSQRPRIGEVIDTIFDDIKYAIYAEFK